ncbi:DNA-directed RNA polymerase I core subunit rpa12 [Tilletia horrida]|nr:DNA-directed RNA polymerase I core subunit rpa12 [Tilletia horrida]
MAIKTTSHPDAFPSVLRQNRQLVSSLAQAESLDTDGIGAGATQEATMQEKCINPKCDSEVASFYTLQMRSADEGSTVFANVRVPTAKMCPVSKGTSGCGVPSTELMICFKQAAIARPGQTGTKAYVLPDRILHPKFALSKPGVGTWVTAARFMVETFVERKSYKRFAQSAEPPRRLIEMIEHQLRLRVLQEAELLIDRKASEPPAGKRSPSTLEPAEDLTRQSFAYLDFRENAPVWRQAVDDRGEADDLPTRAGSVVFGIRALMDLQKPIESSEQEIAEDAETSVSRHEQPTSAEEQASPTPSAESNQMLQRLLRDLLQAGVLIDKDGRRAQQHSFTLDGFSAESGLVFPDELHSVRRHRHTVPIFIAMFRLARFLQAPNQDQ